MALIIGVAMLLAGCDPAQTVSPSADAKQAGTSAEVSEAQRLAEAALGKQAEILAQGDLARNGLEQVLVVNRVAKASASGNDAGNQSRVTITRAAILENDNGKWSEVLRVDEHLKNPRGYLGGAPTGRVTGWHLEYASDPKQGLEMKFTPADGDTGAQDSGSGELEHRSIVVRWNARAKRYQSFDHAQGSYLGEAATLETPESILR